MCSTKLHCKKNTPQDLPNFTLITMGKGVTPVSCKAQGY